MSKLANRLFSFSVITTCLVCTTVTSGFAQEKRAAEKIPGPVPLKAAADKSAGAAAKPISLNADLKVNLEQITQLYAFYDCSKTFTKNAAHLFNAACIDALQNPHVRQARALDSKTAKVSVACTFDGDHYVVATEGLVAAPVYQIDKTGHVSQIVQGDASVDAKLCKTLFDKKSKPSETEEAALDSGTSELCFSYYPGKKAVEFRTEPVCTADADQPAPTGANTPAAAAPVEAKPTKPADRSTATAKPRTPASVDDAHPSETEREIQAEKTGPSEHRGLDSGYTDYPGSAQDGEKIPAGDPVQDVVLPDHSKH